MKIRPLHDRVVVRRVEGEQQTASGLYIPDTAQEKQARGEVVVAGPGRTNDKGDVRALTDTEADESPSFAANSQMLIYATRLNGRDALMTVSSDGNIRTRLAGAVGDIREPDWGPFR